MTWRKISLLVIEIIILFLVQRCITIIIIVAQCSYYNNRVGPDIRSNFNIRPDAGTNYPTGYRIFVLSGRKIVIELSSWITDDLFIQPDIGY